jgi:hypothetical protein
MALTPIEKLQKEAAKANAALRSEKKRSGSLRQRIKHLKKKSGIYTNRQTAWKGKYPGAGSKMYG